MNKSIFTICKSTNGFQHFKGAIDPNTITWFDVDDYLAPLSILNVELIRDAKISIPKIGLYQDKNFIIQQIISEAMFCISKFFNVNPRAFELWSQVCDAYPGQGVDFHLYGGLTADAQSFPPHNDLAANYIVQLDGSCEWTIYNERASYQEALDYVVYPADQLSVKTVQVLNPGDVIFIPAGTHHQCRPLGKRLSLSIPIL